MQAKKEQQNVELSLPLQANDSRSSFDSTSNMSDISVRAWNLYDPRRRHYSALAGPPFGGIPLELDIYGGVQIPGGHTGGHPAASLRPQSVPAHQMGIHSHPNTPLNTADTRNGFEFDFENITNGVGGGANPYLVQKNGVPQNASDDSGLDTLSGVSGEARDRNPSQQSDTSSLSDCRELAMIPQGDPFMGGSCAMLALTNNASHARSYPNTPIPATTTQPNQVHSQPTPNVVGAMANIASQVRE